MKNLKLTLIAALVISTIVVPACRKGENDPSISLRTRKARVAGEWKVTSGTGYDSNSSFTYDGSTYIENGNTSTRTIEYIFEKDGAFLITDIENGKIEKTEGVWNFMGGVGEIKNKSQLALRITKFTDDDGSVDTYDGDEADVVYDIDELRHKKMVLKRQLISTFSSGGSFNLDETWVLEPKKD